MLDLLKRSESELIQWVASQDTGSLRKAFQEIDAEIRSTNLISGQPRSLSSATSVQLARTALRIAEMADNEGLIVEAWRMLAVCLNGDEQYDQCLPYYALAIGGLEKLGDHAFAARTRLGYVSALFLCGRYEEALRVAAVAEKWFTENNDEVRLARLWNNVANLYQRWDRPADAYRYQWKAFKTFEKLGDEHALAVSSQNLALTLSWIDQFEQADEMFEKSETLSRKLGLTETEAMASYNRAYLYYLRGRLSDALQAFSRVRAHFEKTGSRHYALCDLDEAEIYLQLNLSKDAETLARRAAEQFKTLGQTYEHAKAMAFLGVALTQQGRYTDALEVFKASQTQFEKEGNIYWEGVLDLYRAEVHISLKRFWEARSLAAHAEARFAHLEVPSKRILSLVVLGRVSLELKDVAAAEECADRILQLKGQSQASLLLFPYHLLRGDIAEKKEEWEQAETFYESAARDLEFHQARLHHDDLRVTFFRGRNRAYEELVRLKLQNLRTDSISDAYAWCERSKSRGLIELLGQHFSGVQAPGDQPLLPKITRLREELNMLYVRSQPESRPLPSATNFEAITNKENELARTLREVSTTNPEFASLQQVTTATMESVQALLPEDTTLIEYFVARDEVLAFVMSRTEVSVERHLCPISRINDVQQRLAFQLEKFLLGHQYLENHSDQIFMATQRHLTELHRHLVASILGRLRTPKITIVPHGALHQLPFHAFFDGERYLIDCFEISYAPSASVLKYCLEKQDFEYDTAVLIGVADAQAPFVDEEIKAIRRTTRNPTVLLNEAATRESFAVIAARASFLHIATHAVFRQDNPMFSGFKLHDGWVTAFDLFSMNCQTNLVTLSGCKSGMSQVSGSDDLLGLTRGFLYAGARSLMVSLWNVDDEATSLLMSRFYALWQNGATRRSALSGAMKDVRSTYPNPFYWAPFLLIGKP